MPFPLLPHFLGMFARQRSCLAWLLLVLATAYFYQPSATAQNLPPLTTITAAATGNTYQRQFKAHELPFVLPTVERAEISLFGKPQNTIPNAYKRLDNIQQALYGQAVQKDPYALINTLTQMFPDKRLSPNAIFYQRAFGMGVAPTTRAPQATDARTTLQPLTAPIALAEPLPPGIYGIKTPRTVADGELPNGLYLKKPGVLSQFWAFLTSPDNRWTYRSGFDNSPWSLYQTQNTNTW